MKELENGFCLDDSIIVKPIKKKKEDNSRSGILVPDNIKDLDFYDEHPNKGEVVKVGNNIKDNIKIGDILYIDRPPITSDCVVIDKTMYHRVRKGNVLFVERKK